ncbi:MAG TPA: zinc-binding dehydrogenase, partial [Albitalea sp.]|nr:zinc-binding dehydrogenase [Albitalea sp.]
MTHPSSMRAIEVSGYDGPDAMRMVERPVPRPLPGEVLIKVLAAGVNFADSMQARGTYVGGPVPPYAAGFEACGEIVGLGEGDIRWPIGAKVIAFGQGSFAEYMTSNAMTLLALPEGWSPAQGAALGANWLTAYAAVKLVADVKPGQTVLIHAAAGGVGQAAVRLAKHFGARVFATASTYEKLKIAKQLGADELINYIEQDFVSEVKKRTDGHGVDVILESAGGEIFRRNFEAVVPYGKIIVYGVSGGSASIDNVDLLFKHPVQLIGLNMAIQRQFMQQIFPMLGELIASKVIAPSEPSRHPLKDAAKLVADIEARKTSGKHVLV